MTSGPATAIRLIGAADRLVGRGARPSTITRITALPSGYRELGPLAYRQKGMRAVSLLTLSLAVVALAACGSDESNGASAQASSTPTAVEQDASTNDRDVPDAIRCQTQYRPDAETKVGVRESSLLVNRVDDGVLAESEQLTFDNMVLEATFSGALPEGHSFVFRVTTSDGAQLLQSLYQYDTGEELHTSFSGGHGFTGLNYVHHEDASLQVWCAAVDA